MRSRCERMASQREAIYLGLCSVLGYKAENFIWEKSHPFPLTPGEGIPNTVARFATTADFGTASGSSLLSAASMFGRRILPETERRPRPGFY